VLHYFRQTGADNRGTTAALAFAMSYANIAELTMDLRAQQEFTQQYRNTEYIGIAEFRHFVGTAPQAVLAQELTLRFE
jgi:hypothetical protein